MVKLSLFLTIMELSLALAFYVLCYNVPRLTIINKSSSSIANLLIVFSCASTKMGPKKWCFKIIFRRKKSKEDKSNQEKEQSTDEISNGKQNPNEESSNTPNEGLMMERTVPSKLIDNIAATRIQNAFRSFMARRTFQNLSRAEKFDALIQDHMATDQTATTLNYIHSWSRIQDEIRARRICMITAARIKQRRLESQLKVEAKINELETEWCSGSETMEEILSRIHQREEAAIKRERAMAYAFSHQWRPNCNQYFGQASYSLGKESWGWSWMERWVAARPWEVRVQAESPKTKKLNGQQKNTKLDKTNHNETKSPLAKAAQLDKVNHNETKSPLAKAALSNGKETEKGKKNKT